MVHQSGGDAALRETFALATELTVEFGESMAGIDPGESFGD